MELKSLKGCKSFCYATTDGKPVVFGDVKEITARIDDLCADAIRKNYLDVIGETFTVTAELPKPLPPIDIARLMGIEVVVASKAFMAVSSKVVPVKNHRKWRTRKKWMKRYGMKVVYSKEEKDPFILRDAREGDVLIVGPDTWAKVKDSFGGAKG